MPGHSGNMKVLQQNPKQTQSGKMRAAGMSKGREEMTVKDSADGYLQEVVEDYGGAEC